MRRARPLTRVALLMIGAIAGAARAEPPAPPPPAPAPPPATTPRAGPPEPRLERDVVYGHAGGLDLRLDVARPTLGDGPFPAVLCLHGGGWQKGGREDLAGLAVELARRGYVAAAADYRLAPRYRFPAPIEDASCAVRFLRAQAAAWHVDPARIAAWGVGEGGHLALLLGTLGARDGFDGMGGHPEAARRVGAVVAFGAPSDLATWSAFEGAQPYLVARYGKGSAGLLVDFLGTADRRTPVYAQASPRAWVSAGDAPVLSVHGENDPVVPVEQARALHAALRAAGVDERLIVVAGAAHELDGAERDRARDEALRFLAAAMGPPTGAAAAPAADPRASVTWRRDVVYLRTAGVDLHLDVALPVGRQGLTPVVVCFHHGPYTPKARADLHGDLEAYAAAGLAAVTVEYRGPVKGAYPTPVEDGRAALRFVKAHAAEWAVDPARIAVVGAKIGGWVALHLALNPPADDTPRPAVAVVRYAPTDLTDPAFVDNPVVGRLREVLVGQPHPSAEVLRRASPLSYVSTGDPAVLLLHNPLDRAIPFGQSERLAAALATAKAEVRLERLTGSGHGSERVPQTDPDVADAARVLKLTIAFVQAH